MAKGLPSCVFRLVLPRHRNSAGCLVERTAAYRCSSSEPHAAKGWSRTLERSEVLVGSCLYQREIWACQYLPRLGRWCCRLAARGFYRKQKQDHTPLVITCTSKYTWAVMSPGSFSKTSVGYVRSHPHMGGGRPLHRGHRYSIHGSWMHITPMGPSIFHQANACWFNIREGSWPQS